MSEPKPAKKDETAEYVLGFLFLFLVGCGMVILGSAVVALAISIVCYGVRLGMGW